MQSRGLWLTYTRQSAEEPSLQLSSARSKLHSPRQETPLPAPAKLKRLKTQQVAAESAFSIKSNNQIEYTFENESYKSRAKEALMRRM